MSPIPEKRCSSTVTLLRTKLQPSRVLTAMVIVVCIALSSLESDGKQLVGAHQRFKRALYELPAGSEQLLNAQLKTTFSCDGLGYGYYADLDNECKIFHICQSFKMSDGSIYNNHWSFLCPNQTQFNQVSLTCSHPDESVPCQFARDFYYINDYFGDLRAPSIKETDLNQANDLISRAYGSRLTTGSSEAGI